MGSGEVGIERGEEGVVKHGEDLGLGVDVGELLGGEVLPVYDLEGKAGGVAVAKSAEVDPAQVAGAEVAEELQVAEVEPAIGG